MADLNFPQNPNVGDEFSIGSRTWVWNGTAWQLQSAIQSLDPFTVNRLVVTTTTNAIDTTSGAAIIAGGVGIGGDTYIGGNLTVTGTINAQISGVITTATNVAGGAAGSLLYQSDVGLTTSLPIGTTNQILIVNSSTLTPSWVDFSSLTSTTATEAFNVFVNDVSSSATSFYLLLADQYGDFKPINAASTLTFNPVTGILSVNTVSITANTSSTDVSTGALVVTGGAGIGGDVNIGGSLNVAGTINAQISGVITTATNLAGGLADEIPFQISDGVTGFSTDFKYNDTNKNLNVSNASIFGNTALHYGESSSTSVSVEAGSGYSIQLFSNVVSQLNYGNLNTISVDTFGAKLLAGSSFLTLDPTGFVTISGLAQDASSIGYGALRIQNGGVYVGDNVYAVNNVSGGSLTGRNLTNGRIPYTSNGALADSASLQFDGSKILVSELQVSNTGTFQGSVLITSTATSNTLTNGALVVNGGVGIVENLNVGGEFHVWGPTTFSSPVTFSGTATYVYSTNTVYTDNLLHLHESTSTQIEQSWTFDDGKDIGFKFHYFNRADNTGTAAGLILANDTQWLEWYDRGSEGTSSTFVGTSYGNFKLGKIALTDSTNATSTVTGALVVTGGAGFGRDVYVGGNLNVAGTINASINGVSSTATNLANGTANQIPYQVQGGQTGFFGPGTAGQLLVSNGTTAGGPVFTNTGSIYVGFAGAVATQQFSANTNYYLGMFSTTTNSLQTPGVDSALYFNASTNILYAGTFSGSHSGSGAGLTGIPNSALVNSTITVNTGAGIQVQGSPVALGGVFTITNIGVTQFLGGTTGLTSTNSTGVVTLTGTLGTANGGTNNTVIGNAGTVAYSNGSKYVFLNSGTTGAFLTQGNNTIAWTNPSAMSVNSATNLTGITPGAIPIGSATAGVVSYINTGAVGTVLTMAPGNTATWQVVSSITGVGQATTATNLGGGNSGTIPIQIGTGQTVFIGSGTVGAYLTMGVNTATWTVPGAISVGLATTATNIAGGTAGQLHYQSSPGITAFAGPGSAGQILQSNGTSAPSYVAQTTLSVGTATNIAGGNSGLLPIQIATGQTRFVASGTNGSVLVQGTNTASFVAQASLSVGVSTTASNIAGGNSGTIPIQIGSGQTVFIGSGTNGSVLVQGTNTATWNNPATLSVGIATTATNIAGGATGGIPIQSSTGTTSFIPIGSNGYVLTVSGTTATWSPMSGVAAGIATTATNLAGGTAGQVPYQTAAGATSFYGPGTAGQVLVSGGTGAPQYQSTLTLASTVASTNTTTGALTVAGGVGIGGALNVQGNIAIVSTGSGFVQNDTGIVVGVGPNNLDTFSTSTYRSAKYIISVENNWNNTFQTTEALVIHNGTTAFIQESSVFTTATPIMDFDAVIASGVVQLQGTATFNTNTVRVQRFYIVN